MPSPALALLLRQPSAVLWLTGGVYSATPAYTSWGGGTGATVTRSAVIGPDNKLSAMLVVETTTAAATHGAVHTGVVFSQTAIPYIHTVYVKRVVGGRNLMLTHFESTDTFTMHVRIDLATGELLTAPATDGSWTNMSCTVTKVGTWWRVQFGFTGIVDSDMWFVYRLVSGVNENYTGDGASAIAVWGTDLRAA